MVANQQKCNFIFFDIVFFLVSELNCSSVHIHVIYLISSKNYLLLEKLDVYNLKYKLFRVSHNLLILKFYKLQT